MIHIPIVSIPVKLQGEFQLMEKEKEDFLLRSLSNLLEIFFKLSAPWSHVSLHFLLPPLFQECFEDTAK